MSAPSSRARLKSKSSKRLRFTEISQPSPDSRSTITSRPSIAMNATDDNVEYGKSGTRSASASRSKTGQHDGFKQSPQTFSRGNLSRPNTRDTKTPTAAAGETTDQA